MSTPLRNIKSALVPVGAGTDGQTALAIARNIAEEVVLVGIVPIAENESISAGAQIARQVRKRLLAMSKAPSIRFKSSVIVSETPWIDLQSVIASETPDLLIIEWGGKTASCGIPIAEALSNSYCNVAVVRGPTPAIPKKILIAVRGGPSAELAFRIGMGLHSAQMDVLHLAMAGSLNDAPFKGLKHILRQIPEVQLRSITTENASQTIFEESQFYDLVILGATASKSLGSSSIGPAAEKLFLESPSTVMVVKTCHPISESMFDESAGVQAISILVDKWFAENTYHVDEFSDLAQLLELKKKQGVTISLALPALNEEGTVGKVITTVKQSLMERVPLLDEIVLVDSNSTDRTREIAHDLDIPVHIHQKILPELGVRNGKGEALWKSLLVTRGDIIAWIDTDIINIDPRFVYGILGPLLLDRNIQLVKGFYRRPIRVGDKMQAGGGGRVTELAAGLC
jgi:hypothetical protein